MPRLKCPKCGISYARKARHCLNCGINFEHVLHPEPPQRTFFDELFHLLFHLNRKIIRTFGQMVKRPGKTLYKLVREEDRYKTSIVYFCAAVGLYHAISHFIFHKLHFKHVLSGQLGDHITSIIILMILLLVMAIIGYTTLGWWRFKPRDRDNYSASDVLVICFYIYGTNYFLAPFVVAFSQLFNGYFAHNDIPDKTASQITDAPLALFMAFALFRLVMNTPGYKYRYPRYTAFMILAVSYYLFMYDPIMNLRDKLNPPEHQEEVKPGR